MPRTIRSLFLLTLFAVATPLVAQSRDSTVVRTFPLRALAAKDAAQLVSPYVTPHGVVVIQGDGARAITVRDRPSVLATIDSLLKVYDQLSPVVRFNFQLIATSDSTTRDPDIAPVENALRGIFRFKGYRLLAQTTAIVRDLGHFQSTVSADGRRYMVTGTISRVSLGPDGTVRLDVGLDDVTTRGGGIEAAQARAMMNSGRILSTDLTMPLGQTIVLGSGAPETGGHVLILVVRAELQAPAGR